MDTAYAELPGLRNAELGELAALLRDRQARAVDVVAPGALVRANDGRLVVADTEVQLDEDGATQTAGTYRLTGLAEQGLAERLGIPPAYMRRMREQRVDLWDANVNGWLRHDPDAKHLLRILRGGPNGEEEARCPTCWEPYRLLASGAVGHGIDEQDPCDLDWRPEDGVVRSVLSDAYRPIDNLDVLLAALSGVRSAGVQVEVDGADLSERSMQIRVSAPEVRALAPDLLRGYRSPFDGGAVRAGRAASGRGAYAAGDEPVIFAGFVVSNSESGGGSFRITPRLVVQVCRNGLTVTADAMREVHRGARLEAGLVRWSAETQRRTLSLITSQAHDAVKSFLSQAYLTSKIAEMQRDAGVPVADPPRAVEVIRKQLRISEAEGDAILRHFTLGGQATAGGLMQAVSSVAQTLDDADAAAELEARAVPAMALVAAAARS